MEYEKQLEGFVWGFLIKTRIYHFDDTFEAKNEDFHVLLESMSEEHLHLTGIHELILI